MKKSIFIFISLCLIVNCTDNSRNDKNIKSRTDNKTETVQVEKRKPSNPDRTNQSLSKSPEQIVEDNCREIEFTDKKVLKDHTFPFDFEPFSGSCFVTAHDPEYSDPPTALELSLYKDDKKIYTFDSRFNPQSVNCRIDAVSFQDLNQDDLIDVIIVGKCGAKSGETLANEVHMNSGKKTFETRTSANDKLENFTKVKEITDFVKKNQELFFR